LSEQQIARPTNTDRHRELLAAATVVIRECGLHGASMANIAAEARMSKSTLFNYFSSKNELVDRLQ
jgi:AcrR family transcriptional regulator|tara:strand:+ start:2285 stop:2482 length:198 start_codon:yes stop_codon:yes gene_type:complete